MYPTVADDELIFLIRRGSKVAEELLRTRYLTFICQWLDKLFYRIEDYHEREEAFQIAYISLFNSIESYRPQKGLFFTYAKTCVERELRNFNNQTLYNREISGYYHFDENGSDGESNTLYNIQCTHFASDPLRVYLVTEKVEMVLNNKNLKPIEKQIFINRMSGSSYQEIATKLNISTKLVDNTLRRLKEKVK